MLIVASVIGRRFGSRDETVSQVTVEVSWHNGILSSAISPSLHSHAILSKGYRSHMPEMRLLQCLCMPTFILKR